MEQEKEFVFEELKSSCIQTLKALANKLDDSLSEEDINNVLNGIEQNIFTVRTIQRNLYGRNR